MSSEPIRRTSTTTQKRRERRVFRSVTSTIGWLVLSTAVACGGAPVAPSISSHGDAGDRCAMVDAAFQLDQLKRFASGTATRDHRILVDVDMSPRFTESCSSSVFAIYQPQEPINTDAVVRLTIGTRDQRTWRFSAVLRSTELSGRSSSRPRHSEALRECWLRRFTCKHRCALRRSVDRGLLGAQRTQRGGSPAPTHVARCAYVSPSRSRYAARFVTAIGFIRRRDRGPRRC